MFITFAPAREKIHVVFNYSYNCDANVDEKICTVLQIMINEVRVENDLAFKYLHRRLRNIKGMNMLRCCQPKAGVDHQ